LITTPGRYMYTARQHVSKPRGSGYRGSHGLWGAKKRRREQAPHRHPATRPNHTEKGRRTIVCTRKLSLSTTPSSQGRPTGLFGWPPGASFAGRRNERGTEKCQPPHEHMRLLEPSQAYSCTPAQHEQHQTGRAPCHLKHRRPMKLRAGSTDAPQKSQNA